MFIKIKKENRKYWIAGGIILLIILLLLFGNSDWFSSSSSSKVNQNPVVRMNSMDSIVNASLAMYGLIDDNDGDNHYDIQHLETKKDSKEADEALGTRISNQNPKIEEAKKLPKPRFYDKSIKELKGQVAILTQQNEALQDEVDDLKKNGITQAPADNSGGDDGAIDWRKEFGLTGNNKPNKSSQTTYSNLPGDVTDYEWIGHIGGKYGVTVNGIGYVHKEVVELVHGSNPSFMCEYTNWYDNGAPMYLDGDYWICNTGHELKAEEKNRIFTYCIYIGGERYLPHELHKLGQIQASDYVANGQGGFNFTTYPTGELKTHQ